MLSSRKHGFVLIPDKAVFNETLRLSREFEHNYIKLDETLTMPHVTVLQTFFKPDFNYKKALEELRDYSGFTYEPRTFLDEITVQATFNHGDIVWWGIKNATWLKVFNRELIESLAENLLLPEDVDSRVFQTPESKESYERTGYERNLDAYEPHLTLAVTDEEIKTLPTTTFKGSFIRLRELAFVEHGAYGEITKILASKSLPVAWD